MPRLLHYSSMNFTCLCVCAQILTIGKSINFLRQLCDDHTPLGSKAQQQLYSDLSSHAPSYKDCDPFTVRTGPVLKVLHTHIHKYTHTHIHLSRAYQCVCVCVCVQTLVEYSYKETSHHLLQVMYNKYHLMEHLKVRVRIQTHTSRHTQTHVDTSRHIQTHLDTCRHIQTHLDTCRHTQPHLDTSRHM